MNESIQLAVQITVIGMSLVFLTILLLWGVMVVLVRSTSKQHHNAQTELETDEHEMQNKRSAAAVAVAVALARQANMEEPHEFPLPPTALVSAWQAVMRSRIINKRGTGK